MNILIIGAGDIGFQLAKRLSTERHDITIVEQNPERVTRASEQLDAIVVEGHGSSLNILKQAGIEHTDILVAMTNNDEVNLLACQIAKKLNVQSTIARVRNPELTESNYLLSREELGVDMIIHPEKETADAIVRLLRQSAATDIVEFGGGKCVLIGIRLDEDLPVLRTPLKDLASKFSHIPQRVVAIHRKQKTIIPGGDHQLQKGDQMFLVCHPNYMQDIIDLTGKSGTKINDVMILGGGLIGQFIANNISKEINTKVIESSASRSRHIANVLSSSLIIHGSGTDIDLLAAEGIMDMDAFVAVTGDDETNIISTLVARHLEVQRTIALVNNVEYLPITPTIGMDAVVSKQLITVNAVQRFIRHQTVATVASLPEIEAETIEFHVNDNSKITKKPLKDIKFPKSAIVGAILREDEYITPMGNTQIQAGDDVIVFMLPHTRDQVEKLFR